MSIRFTSFALYQFMRPWRDLYRRVCYPAPIAIGNPQRIGIHDGFHIVDIRLFLFAIGVAIVLGRVKAFHLKGLVQ
jgi:hypothetical protein